MPLEALCALAVTFADLRQRDALTEPPWCLPLCSDCERALWQELSGMFTPVQGPRGMTLHTSQVLGFTFDHGPPEACALHALLQKDEVCP